MPEIVKRPGIERSSPLVSEGGDAARAQDIGFLSAEFSDPAIEQRFRQRDEGAIARHAGIAVLIAAVLNLAFGYNDYIVLGAGAQLWFLLGARMAVLALAVAGTVAMLRRPHLATSGMVPTALEVAFFSCFILVVLTRPAGMQWHVMMMVIITLAFYMFVPNRFICMTAIGLASMAVFLSSAIAAISPNYLDTSRMVLILSSANMIGLICAYRFSKLRRREFWLLQMSERANAQLRAEVAERQRLAEELKRMAATDELTGLANRRHYLDLSSQEIKRARRLNKPLTVCVLDVDHFKHINDNHGHAVGDAALRAVAEACRDSLREMDILARFGGEEFTITLPDTDALAAQEVAERLRARIEAVRLDVDGLRLSATIGLAERRDDDDIEQLLMRADQALYEGKRGGRNRVVGAQRSLA
jgi:diguanylate cyclase (GGDEF)-like protein